MQLKEAVIDNMIDRAGSEIEFVKDFGTILQKEKLIADVFVNELKLFSAPAIMSENNGYLISIIDGRFSLSPSVVANSVLIRIHYVDSDEILFSSYTNNINFKFDAGDYDADLYFKVLSKFQYNTLKCDVPDSKFIKLGTYNFTAFNLEESEPANKNVITITLPTGDHFSADLDEENTNAEEGTFVFTVTADEDYEVTVKHGEEELTAVDGKYTVTGATDNVEITIIATPVEGYAVLLTITDGNLTTNLDDDENSVAPGENFSFTVISSNEVIPHVDVNGSVLSSTSVSDNEYSYTIENIHECKFVTISAAT